MWHGNRDEFFWGEGSTETPENEVPFAVPEAGQLSVDAGHREINTDFWKCSPIFTGDRRNSLRAASCKGSKGIY